MRNPLHFSFSEHLLRRNRRSRRAPLNKCVSQQVYTLHYSILLSIALCVATVTHYSARVSCLNDLLCVHKYKCMSRTIMCVSTLSTPLHDLTIPTTQIEIPCSHVTVNRVHLPIHCRSRPIFHIVRRCNIAGTFPNQPTLSP